MQQLWTGQACHTCIIRTMQFAYKLCLSATGYAYILFYSLQYLHQREGVIKYLRQWASEGANVFSKPEFWNQVRDLLPNTEAAVHALNRDVYIDFQVSCAIGNGMIFVSDQACVCVSWHACKN